MRYVRANTPLNTSSVSQRTYPHPQPNHANSRSMVRCELTMGADMTRIGLAVWACLLFVGCGAIKMRSGEMQTSLFPSNAAAEKIGPISIKGWGHAGVGCNWNWTIPGKQPFNTNCGVPVVQGASAQENTVAAGNGSSRSVITGAGGSVSGYSQGQSVIRENRQITSQSNIADFLLLTTSPDGTQIECQHVWDRRLDTGQGTCRIGKDALYRFTYQWTVKWSDPPPT